MLTVKATIKVDEESVVKALHFCGVYKSQDRASRGFSHHWVAVWGDHRLYAIDKSCVWGHFDNLKQTFPDKHNRGK